MTWWQWILGVLGGIGLAAACAGLLLGAARLGWWIGGRS